MEIMMIIFLKAFFKEFLQYEFWVLSLYNTMCDSQGL